MRGYNFGRKRSFFTFDNLFPMFVIGFIVLIFGGVAFAVAGRYLFANKVRANAERYATSYAREIEGMTSPRVQCMSMDTDINGYVTCSIRDGAVSGSRSTQIECVANMFTEFNTGCRGYRVRTLDINTTSDQQ